jgi:hypothetical protein
VQAYLGPARREGLKSYGIKKLSCSPPGSWFSLHFRYENQRHPYSGQAYEKNRPRV